jgi:hypothetical protein
MLERYPILNVLRQGLTLVVIVLVVGVVFWAAMRRMARLRGGDADEQRESIASRSLLWRQLRDLLRRRRQADTAAGEYLDLSGPADDPRLMVRRAYQGLLAWARAKALPRRRAGQTPTTYARVLDSHLPNCAADLETLTRVYGRARYGGLPPSLAEAQAAQAALRAVQAAEMMPAAPDEAAMERLPPENGRHEP